MPRSTLPGPGPRFAAALLAAGLIAAAAARAEQVTLASALARARSAAPEVEAAEARVEASRERLRQARSHRLPTLALSEVWMRTNSPAEVFALQLNQERFSFADFVTSDPNSPAALESATTRLSVTLPLYTGGELAGRIEQAALASEAAAERAQRSADQAALAAGMAYIRLAQAREHVALMERSLATVEAHVDLARAYADQGMLVRSELLRAEVEKARISDLLIAARGRARVAAANLSFRLAARPDGEWELDDLPPPAPLAAEPDSWLAAAENRADLEAARRLLDAGTLEARIQRSNRLPKVGFMARHDLVDSSPFGSHGDSTAFMAVATIDLWSGGRHAAAAAAAEAELAAARSEIEHFSAAVALEVEDAWDRARTAGERHETALAALAAGREAERIVGERFKQGVVKTIDVLDAATARREAEMRELVARADTHLARLELALAAGLPPESALADSGAPAASRGAN